MSDNTVQTLTGERVQLLGHWLYVRKCKVPDIIDSATGKVLLELPALTKDFADQLFAWVELLGKGPEVGKPSSGAYGKERKQRGYARHIPDVLNIGDLLLIPIQPWKMMHSPYCPVQGIDFFIDETVPLCAVPAEKEQAA